MSIEENSSGKTLDATLAALASNVRLPEGVTSGDKPLAETDSALGLASNVRLPEGVTSDDLLYAVTEAAPSAFEEAARAFIAEQQAPAKTAPALALVEKDAEAKALEELKPLKQFYMKQIEELISKAMDPDVIAALREVLKEIGLAKDASSISAALANAPSAATAAMAKVETPEQQVERLWNDVKEMNKKIDSAFDDLKAKGVVFDEEDEKKREELKKRIAAGDFAAQQELQKLEAQMVEKAKRDHPELSKEIGEVEKLLKEREKVFKEYIEKAKELGTKSADDIKRDEKAFKESEEQLKKEGDTASILESIERLEKQHKELKQAQKPDYERTRLPVADAAQAESKQPASSPPIVAKVSERGMD